MCSHKISITDVIVKEVSFPTSPDDILGHAKIAKAVHPIKVATGEHCKTELFLNS